MTRKAQRNKSVASTKVTQNSLSDITSNNSDSLGDNENVDHSTTSCVVNGKAGSEKSNNLDAKDVPLKDRLRSQRVEESTKTANSFGKRSCAKAMENNTDESLADKASTSERDLNKTASSGKNVGDVKSLAVLLGQGLTSGDSEKIDSVLSNGDVQTISATLNDLPITQIVPLLKQIEHRLKNRNVHDIRIWVRWLQYIVSTHMAYLSTLETLEDDLKDLFDWMRNRTSQMGKLCSLYGKLSLITEQIERRVNPHLFILQEPVALFEEDNLSLSESSEELDDLEDESIESDDDWWDDEEIASGSDQDVSDPDENLNDSNKKRKHLSDGEESEDEEQKDEGSSGMETE